MSKHKTVSKGDIFGLLTVIGYSHSLPRKNGKAGQRYMLCQCSCGNKKAVRVSNLNSGVTKSCGCLKRVKTIESNIARATKRKR